MKKFKRKYGFEYSDIWNLDQTLVGFLLPRIAFFAENHTGFPCDLDDLDESGRIKDREKVAEKYQEKLDTIVEGLYLYYSKTILNEEEQETWENAKKYLAETFESWWD